jgi:lysozyme
MTSPTTTTSNQNTSQQGTSSGSYTGNTSQQGTNSSTSNTAQNTATSSTTGPAAAAMAILQKYGTNGLSQDDINKYLDPNLASRLSALQGQQNANNAVQQNSLKGNAISMGALGGDRAQVAQAELMRGQGLNDASALSAERSGAYHDALAAAQADRSAALQAAGMMGTTTTGTGSTTGTANTTGTSSQTGTTSGSNQAQSQSTGTSSGTSTTSTPFNPMSLAPLAMALLAHGGRVHRDMGGGVGGYIPIPRINFAPVQGAPTAAQPDSSQMFKLGQKARGGIDKFLDTMQNGPDTSGGWRATTEPTGGNDLGSRLGSFAGGNAVQGGILGGLSSLAGFAGGGCVHRYDGGVVYGPYEGENWAPPEQQIPIDQQPSAVGMSPELQPVTSVPVQPQVGLMERLFPHAYGRQEPSIENMTGGATPTGQAPAGPVVGLGALATAPKPFTTTSEPTPGDAGAVVNPVQSFRVEPPASVLAPALGAGPHPVGANVAPPPGAVAEPATTLSDNGVNFLKTQEVYNSRPYWDVKRNSIGYGTPAKPGETSIDSDEAERRLRAHAGKVSDYLNKNVTQPLNQNQHDALVSFGYNLGTGEGGLADIMPLVNKGDFAGAAEKMQHYNHAAGAVNANLTARRADEAAMLQGGDTPAARGVAGNMGGAPSGGGGIAAGLVKSDTAGGNAASATPAATSGDRGGLLKRLLGIDFNPLKLSDTERMALLAGGAGGVGAGLDMYKSLRGQELTQSQHKAELALRQQQIDQAKQSFGVIGQNADMMPRYGFIDAAANTIKPANEVMGVPTSAPTSNLHGEAYLNTLDPSVRNQVQDVIEGREAMPQISKGNPMAYQIQQAVRQTDPTYNATRYDYQHNWTTPNKGIGVSVKAFDTFGAHADDLYTLANNLPNSNLGPLSSAANSAQVWWKQKSNDPELNAYKAKAELVADEKVRAMLGAGGGEGDRLAALAKYDPALGKTAVQRTLLEDVKAIRGKAHALQEDYKRNMGPYAKVPEVFSDETKAAFQRFDNRTGKTNQDRPEGMSNDELRRKAVEAINRVPKGPARDQATKQVQQQLQQWGAL